MGTSWIDARPLHKWALDIMCDRISIPGHKSLRKAAKPLAVFDSVFCFASFFFLFRESNSCRPARCFPPGPGGGVGRTLIGCEEGCAGDGDGTECVGGGSTCC